MKDYIIIKRQGDTIETFNVSTPYTHTNDIIQFSGWPFIYSISRIQRLTNTTNKSVELHIHSFSGQGQHTVHTCTLLDVIVHQRILTIKLRIEHKHNSLFNIVRNLFHRATPQGYADHGHNKTLKS